MAPAGGSSVIDTMPRDDVLTSQTWRQPCAPQPPILPLSGTTDTTDERGNVERKVQPSRNGDRESVDVDPAVTRTESHGREERLPSAVGELEASHRSRTS